ncbi:MAG TPA: hypothetical protein VNI52_13835 [Sphingobacteriaceae bacterium]|nr:hypothetical protein [Sphingobacteriaceae bacterium]
MGKTLTKTDNNTENIQCIEALKDFFNHHSLEESRNALWKWLNVTACRSFGNLNPAERENLLVFYAHLQGLLESIHDIKTALDKDKLK